MHLKDILLNRDKGAGELLLGAVAWLDRHRDALDEPRLQDTLRILRTTRPAMVGFAVLADRIEQGIRADPRMTQERLLRSLQRALREADEQMVRSFVQEIWKIGPCRAITLSWSSSVLRALEAAREMLTMIRVLKSEPGGEGRRMHEAVQAFAREAVLAPDRDLPEAAAHADFGVIGADTVFSDGSVLNKVLSARLAEVLQQQGKPLYVLATTWKRASFGPESYVPEEKDRDIFEVVPAALITRVITE